MNQHRRIRSRQLTCTILFGPARSPICINGKAKREEGEDENGKGKRRLLSLGSHQMR